MERGSFYRVKFNAALTDVACCGNDTNACGITTHSRLNTNTSLTILCPIHGSMIPFRPLHVGFFFCDSCCIDVTFNIHCTTRKCHFDVYDFKFKIHPNSKVPTCFAMCCPQSPLKIPPRIENICRSNVASFTVI